MSFLDVGVWTDGRLRTTYSCVVIYFSFIKIEET